jgi:hypothetical protein
MGRACVVADALRVDVARTLVVLAGSHGFRGPVGLRGDDACVFVPRASPEQYSLERRLRAGVRRIRFEGAPERAVRAVGVVQVPVAQRTRRAMKRAPGDRIVGELRHAVDHIDHAGEDHVIGPHRAVVDGARAQVERQQRVEHSDVVRLERVQLVRRPHCRGDVSRNVVLDGRRLPQQRGALVSLGDVRELGTDPLEHVHRVRALLGEPAPRARDEARLGSQLRCAREGGGRGERIAHGVEPDPRLGSQERRRACRMPRRMRVDLARKPFDRTTPRRRRRGRRRGLAFGLRASRSSGRRRVGLR